MVDRGRLDIGKDLSFVDPRIISHTPSERVALLPEDYVVGPWDVVCSGGRESFDHVGNRRFRYCIENNLPTYVKAKSKHERSLIVTIIVDAIRDSNAGGVGTGFVRKDLSNGRWYEVGDKVAREKVGHALRDLIKAKEATARKLASASRRTADKDTSCVPRKKRQRRESSLSRQEDKGYSPLSLLSNPSDMLSKNKVGTEYCTKPETVRSSRLVLKNNLSSDGNVTSKGSITPMNPQRNLNSDSRVIDPYDSDDSDRSGDSDVSVDAEMERDYQAALRYMDAPLSIATKPLAAGISTPNPTSSWTPPCDNEAEKAYQAFMKQMGTSTPPPLPDMLPRRIKGGGGSSDALQSRHTDQEKAYQSLINQMKIAAEDTKALVSQQTDAGYKNQSPQPANSMIWNPPGDEQAEKAYQAFMSEMNPELSYSSTTVQPNNSCELVVTPEPLPGSTGSICGGQAAATSADEAYQAFLREGQGVPKDIPTMNTTESIDMSLPPSDIAETMCRVKQNRQNSTLNISKVLNPRPIKEGCTKRMGQSNRPLAVSGIGVSGAIPVLGSRQRPRPRQTRPVGNNFISIIIPP